MTAHSSDQNTEHLLRLRDDVDRIAGTLARLSTVYPGPVQADAGAIPEISAAQVMAVIRARRARGNYLPDELFADPAWDIMLHLLHAEIAHGRVSVSSACLASGLPERVGLRWLNTMAEHGLAQVHADPNDSAGGLVELAPEVSRALRRYFREVVEQQ